MQGKKMNLRNKKKWEKNENPDTTYCTKWKTNAGQTHILGNGNVAFVYQENGH